MNFRGTKTLRDYLSYWKIKEPVFQTKLSHDNIFLTEKWRQALDRFSLFCGRPGSLSVLTSPRGHCKSTLLNWIFHNLDVSSHEVAIISLFEHQRETGWLLKKLGEHFGIIDSTGTELLKKVSEAIEEINQLGKIFTILVDEAHKLIDPAAFSEVHSLLSINSLRETGINFVLAGDPFLFEMLQQTTDLESRVLIAVKFNALTFDETARYLTDRMANANINPRMIDNDCQKEIFRLTRGIFSKVNALMENALIESFIRDQRIIDAAVIDAAGSYALKIHENEVLYQNSPKSHAKGNLGNIHQKTETNNLRDNRKTAKPKDKAQNQSSVELSSLFYKSDDK